MNEENKKEFLTKEIIAKELISVYRKNLWVRIGLAIPSSLLIIMFLLIFIFEGARSEEFAQLGVKLFNAAGVIFVIVVGGFICYLFHSIYKFAAFLYCAKKKKFKVVTDKLVYSEIDGGHKFYIDDDEFEYIPDHRIPCVFLYPQLAMHTNKDAHFLFRLQFAKYKNFYIPEGKLYRWSDKYRMEHWAVHRWADVGDEFYLVTFKDKVLYVYNTKYFELKD